MAQPFIGEIRMVGFSFAPVNWAFCNGQLIPISQNEALFQLIGTIYGGDGVNTFQLPDLRGRIPVHQGTGFGTTTTIGQISGSETVTLTTPQLPGHTHPAFANNGTSGGAQNSPVGAFCNKWSGAPFSSAASSTALNGAAVASTGGSQPHDNIPPFLAISFVIALFGIFPSQN